MPASLSKQYVLALFEIKLRVAVSLAFKLHPSDLSTSPRCERTKASSSDRERKHPNYNGAHVRG